MSSPLFSPIRRFWDDQNHLDHLSNLVDHFLEPGDHIPESIQVSRLVLASSRLHSFIRSFNHSFTPFLSQRLSVSSELPPTRLHVVRLRQRICEILQSCPPRQFGAGDSHVFQWAGVLAPRSRHLFSWQDGNWGAEKSSAEGPRDTFSAHFHFNRHQLSLPAAMLDDPIPGIAVCDPSRKWQIVLEGRFDIFLYLFDSF